jgi:hypothetical protein
MDFFSRVFVVCGENRLFPVPKGAIGFAACGKGLEIGVNRLVGGLFPVGNSEVPVLAAGLGNKEVPVCPANREVELFAPNKDTELPPANSDVPELLPANSDVPPLFPANKEAPLLPANREEGFGLTG